MSHAPTASGSRSHATSSDGREDPGLHLPSLTIKGFRGFRELAIPKLGRVTLIAGKNGVGKTTVLEAVSVFAARGRYSALADLLAGREELAHSLADPEERMSMVSELDWSALFYGRDPIAHDGVRIGAGGDGSSGSVALNTSPVEEDDEQHYSLLDHLPESPPSHHGHKFTVRAEGSEYILPLVLVRDEWDQYFDAGRQSRIRQEWPSRFTCNALGPGLLTNTEIAHYWSKIALTEEQDRAVEAVRLVLGNEVRDVAVVPNQSRHSARSSYRSRSHRVIVSLADQRRPVPLRSLGDGAVRAFSAALGLVHSRGGFLLIDEVENGVHHSVQRNFWKMILRSAQRNNVQVFATTHSWDTARGFAEATAENDAHDGILVRLDKYEDRFRVVSYSEDRLTTAAEQGIEVR